MKLSFRQGIVKTENAQSPAILTPTSLGAQTVNLNVSNQPVIVTFAHHDANYIIQENNTIVGAWGGGGNPNNGPMIAGSTYYMYWELDLSTAALKRGWTTIPWVYGAEAPADPQVGQHWFDTVNTKMRVWKQTGSNNGYWQDVIRVFAGIYNGSTVTVYPLGSQVGISGEFEGGNILLGTNNAPLRQADGSFATTATPLIIQQTSGQNVKFEAALVFGQAIEEIPSHHMVSFASDGRIKLARSGAVDECAIGIVLSGLPEGEVGQVVTSGIVRNSNWDFTDEQVGKPLYLGPTGELWLIAPPGGLVQRIGEVYSRTAVNLNIQQPIRVNADASLVTAKVLAMQTDGHIAQVDMGAVGDDQTASEVPIESIEILGSAANVQEALEEIGTQLAQSTEPTASEVPIDAIEILGSAANVQEALEEIGTQLAQSTEPTASEVPIDAIAGLDDISNVQEALEALATGGGGEGGGVLPQNTSYGYLHEQDIPSTEWEIVHNGNTTNVHVSVFKGYTEQIIPHAVSVLDENTILVELKRPMTGCATVQMFALAPRDIPHGDNLDFRFAYLDDSNPNYNIQDIITPLETLSNGIPRALSTTAPLSENSFISDLSSGGATPKVLDAWNGRAFISYVTYKLEPNAWNNLEPVLYGSSVAALKTWGANNGVSDNGLGPVVDTFVVVPDTVKVADNITPPVSSSFDYYSERIYCVTQTADSVAPVNIMALKCEDDVLTQVGTTLSLPSFNDTWEADKYFKSERKTAVYDGHFCVIDAFPLGQDLQYNVELRAFRFNGTDLEQVSTPNASRSLLIENMWSNSILLGDTYVAFVSSRDDAGSNLVFYKYDSVNGWQNILTWDMTPGWLNYLPDNATLDRLRIDPVTGMIYVTYYNEDSIEDAHLFVIKPDIDFQHVELWAAFTYYQDIAYFDIVYNNKLLMIDNNAQKMLLYTFGDDPITGQENILKAEPIKLNISNSGGYEFVPFVIPKAPYVPES